MFAGISCIKVMGTKYKTNLKGKEQRMNKYIILIKYLQQIAPFGGIFEFSSRLRGHIPLRLPPLKAVSSQITGKIQNYWKNGNEQEIHLFLFKKATNQQIAV